MFRKIFLNLMLVAPIVALSVTHYAQIVHAQDSSLSNSGCSVAWGYINRKGKFVIAPNLKYARDFSDDVAWIQPCEDADREQVLVFILINAKGERLLKQPGSYASGTPCSFHCGLAKAQDPVTWKYGFMNKKGEIVIPYKYRFAGEFSDGRAEVTISEAGKYTRLTIDTKGDTVPDGESSSQSSAGGNVVEGKDGRLKFVSDNRFISALGRNLSFSEGLARVAWYSEGQRRQGFVDKDMNIAFTLAPEIEDAGDFHCGLASVLVKASGEDQLGRPLYHRIGFIDKTGALVIPAKYQPQRATYVRFADGVARVRLDGFNSCYINKQGDLIGKYCRGRDFHDGLAAVAVVKTAEGKILDPSDNSHGYQSRLSYELALYDLLKDKLAILKSPVRIEFEVHVQNNKIAAVKIMQPSDNVRVQEDEAKLVSLATSLIPPKAGLLLSAEPLTFDLLNGKLDIGFTQNFDGNDS